ncbi:MAG: hypothetical protein A2176_01560 [Spirochaetes bacterium RBG_13_51_14]|nr:MAG: hypothetical protein A2176_01560 [Spirochaetes bacterium RBG_13_51_14]
MFSINLEDLKRTLDKEKKSRIVFTYSTIGIQLAATVTAFIVGGYKLDEYLDKSPVFITIGAFVGMAIGFYHLIRQLRDIDQQDKGERNKERKKWL